MILITLIIIEVSLESSYIYAYQGNFEEQIENTTVAFVMFR